MYVKYITICVNKTVRSNQQDCENNLYSLKSLNPFSVQKLYLNIQ